MDEEACDFTAYQLRLLIKIVTQGEACYWEKWRKKVEKVTREANVHLCVVELLHNTIKQLSKEKHEGAKEIHFLSRQYWKPRRIGSGETKTKKNEHHPQRKRRQHTQTGNTHEQGNTAALSFQHWARHDITGAKEPIMRRGSAPSQRWETHAAEKNTRTHTHTYTLTT